MNWVCLSAIYTVLRHIYVCIKKRAEFSWDKDLWLQKKTKQCWEVTVLACDQVVTRTMCAIKQTSKSRITDVALIFPVCMYACVIFFIFRFFVMYNHNFQVCGDSYTMRDDLDIKLIVKCHNSMWNFGIVIWLAT